MSQILSMFGKKVSTTEKFSPRVDPARRKRTLSDSLQLVPSTTVAASGQRYENYRTKTSQLRRWLADFLFCILLRREHGDPLPTACMDPHFMTTLSFNIFEFLWSGSNPRPSPEKLAYVALYYASQLLPNGLLERSTLYSPNGVTVATRLFAITFSIAAKCFSEPGYKHFYQKSSLLKSKLTAFSALTLELAMIDALSIKSSIFLQFGGWSRHLQVLLDWTINRGHTESAYQVVGDHLRRLLCEASTSSHPSGYDYKSTPSRPLDVSRKVITNLVVDLSM